MTTEDKERAAIDEEMREQARAATDEQLLGRLRRFDDQVDRLRNRPTVEEIRGRIRRWIAEVQGDLRQLTPTPELEAHLAELGVHVLFLSPTVAKELEEVLVEKLTSGLLTSEDRQRCIGEIWREHQIYAEESRRRGGVRAKGPAPRSPASTKRRRKLG